MNRIIIVGRNSEFPTLARKSQQSAPKITENWADRIIDAVTVISGMAAFGMIALFLLVMA